MRTKVARGECTAVFWTHEKHIGLREPAAPRKVCRVIGDRSRVPAGPTEKYDTEVDLLTWLGEQFTQFGDIFRASIYGADVYVVSSPEYIEHVLLKNWENYPKGLAIKRIALLLGNGLMVSKGSLWKRQRRMIQPAFNRSALSDFAEVIVDANIRLRDAWEVAAQNGTTVNVTGDISLMILEIVLRSIFGEDYEQVAPQFRVVSEEAKRDLAFAHVFTGLDAIIKEIVQQRRNANRVAGDFLGRLMEARDRDSGQPMSDAQLSKEIMTLVIAGHETTASTLNWTWFLLSRHDDAEAKMARELRQLPNDFIPSVGDLATFVYTRKVIEEAMRLYPPGWLLTRRAIKDDHLGEFFVPAGTEIYISPYYIQRHPALWENPNDFDPDRFDSDVSPKAQPHVHLPFSIGPRNCIGEHLARMEMQFHLIIIGSRLRLRATDGAAPTFSAQVNLLSATDFMMVPELRKPVLDASS